MNKFKKMNMNEWISKTKSFINKYNWKEINFPSHKNDRKKFERNNKTIALNILDVPYDREKIRHTYISKHNSRHENQVILSMITDNEKWLHLDVKRYLDCFAE